MNCGIGPMIEATRRIEREPADTPVPMTDAGPDWARITEEINCPLCDYNLRGLQQGRCPECGYYFDWLELIDLRRRRHPFLFEHHPGKTIRSLLKTLAAGLLPRRFWRNLNAAQEIHTKRLLGYWAITTFITIALTLATLWAWEFTEQAPQFNAQRNYIRSEALAHPNSPTVIQLTRQYGSFEAFLDAHYPKTPLNVRLLSSLTDAFRTRAARFIVYPCLRVYLIWPFASLLGLLVFRWTMKRVNVNKAHVIRCIIYSQDAWLWYSLFTLAVVLSRGGLNLLTGGQWLTPTLLTAGAIFCMLHTIYRLIIAYRAYMRFDRAVATVLCAQLISALLVMTALSYYAEWKVARVKFPLF